MRSLKTTCEQTETHSLTSTRRRNINLRISRFYLSKSNRRLSELSEIRGSNKSYETLLSLLRKQEEWREFMNRKKDDSFGIPSFINC